MITKKDVTTGYPRVRQRILDLMTETNSAREVLEWLTDRELAIWIASETIAFGRPLDKAVANANSHLQDRKKAIDSFVRVDIEKSLV